MKACGPQAVRHTYQAKPEYPVLQLRPYLFEKLLLGFILQQNGSVGRKKRKEKLANYRFRHVYDIWSQFIIY